MKYLLLCLLIFLQLSCKSDKDRLREEEIIKIDLLKSSFRDKYNPLSVDTLYEKYSFQVTELLKNNKYFEIDNYKLLDIIEKDSNYYVLIDSYSYANIILNLSCDKNQVDKFLEQENYYILIVLIDSIEKINFEYVPYNSFAIEIQNSPNRFKSNGKLIEIGEY